MSATPERGKFRVVEAIKGDTPIGTVLTLPELAPPEGDTTSMAEVSEREDPRNGRQPPEFAGMTIFPAPPLGASDRTIVFLRRPGFPPEYPRNAKANVIGWQPASFYHELRASAVWLQDGMAFGYAQTSNPGASHLIRMEVTEDQVRQRIRTVLDLRAALDRALGSKDPADRARQLAALVRSGDSFARGSALRHLESGGAKAVDMLDKLLATPDLQQNYGEIARSLVKTNLANIHLPQILGREAQYWNKTCPELPPDWAHGAFEASRSHFYFAVALLRLPSLRSTRDRDALAAFAQVWKTCPPMDVSPPAKDEVSTEINRLFRLWR